MPCEAIYEPDWRTGKHMPTGFSAADGGTLGVVGIWSLWKTPEGQWVGSFAMLTTSADDHALMRNMHRSDPKRPPEMQDKRMALILPDGRYEAGLEAPAANSMDFMRQSPAERLLAIPQSLPPKTTKLTELARSDPAQGGLL